jgi:hypothetical protein
MVLAEAYSLEDFAMLQQAMDQAAEEAESVVPIETAEPIPQSDRELAATILRLTGLRLAERAVCPGHTAPLKAFADAFFGRHRVIVWKASRGLGGKTTMLALLGHMETAVLGAEVTILGGSGQQSQRVHEAQEKFWKHPSAPLDKLISDPTKYETKLTNGGRTVALMASTRSARGPHPQRLRLDEVDEIKLDILDASLGQTLSARGIGAQTVMSSTHQYADGTMTEVLKRATDRGWPVYEWCYRENHVSNGGWADDEQIEGKRSEVTAAMWAAEYELGEPSPESRAILPEMVERMFRPELGEFGGRPGEAIEIEPPEKGATYATGADWAKDQDWTVVWTFRTDLRPMRLVAYRRDGRRPWPLMVEILDDRQARYPGPTAHDATGLGDVVDDLLSGDADGVKLVGRTRADLLSDYIKAIENGELEAPRIEHTYGEHKYATLGDLYGSGHLPDSICAGALALYAYRHPPKQRAVYVY